ncbi:MAG: acyl-CoA dehydrogenase family protein [bacterium]
MDSAPLAAHPAGDQSTPYSAPLLVIAASDEQTAAGGPDPRDVVATLAPAWAEHEREASAAGLIRLPTDTLNDFRRSGLLGAPLPRELGGWDADLATCAEAIRAVARVAPSTALALAMPWGNTATTRLPLSAIDPAYREDLVVGKRWIADRIAEGKILAVANSEPGAGGELANTRTTAELDDQQVWRLTGRKSFATIGPDADYFLCAARRPGADGVDVIDGFFVAAQAENLHIDDCWNPLGMRVTASVGLALDHTPAEVVFGYPGCLSGINARHWSTVLFAAVFLGIGEGAIDAAIKYGPVGSIWVQGTLAEARLTLDAAAGFMQAVAASETWPIPSDYQERCRRVKTFAAKSALEAATKAAMIAGGRAYSPDHPIARLLCDAVAGPLLRPPLPAAMDAIAASLGKP